MEGTQYALVLFPNPLLLLLIKPSESQLPQENNSCALWDFRED